MIGPGGCRQEQPSRSVGALPGLQRPHVLHSEAQLPRPDHQDGHARDGPSHAQGTSAVYGRFQTDRNHMPRDAEKDRRGGGSSDPHQEPQDGPSFADHSSYQDKDQGINALLKLRHILGRGTSNKAHGQHGGDDQSPHPAGAESHPPHHSESHDGRLPLRGDAVQDEHHGKRGPVDPGPTSTSSMATKLMFMGASLTSAMASQVSQLCSDDQDGVWEISHTAGSARPVNNMVYNHVASTSTPATTSTSQKLGRSSKHFNVNTVLGVFGSPYPAQNGVDGPASTTTIQSVVNF